MSSKQRKFLEQYKNKLPLGLLKPLATLAKKSSDPYAIGPSPSGYKQAKEIAEAAIILHEKKWSCKRVQALLLPAVLERITYLETAALSLEAELTNSKGRPSIYSREEKRNFYDLVEKKKKEFCKEQEYKRGVLTAAIHAAIEEFTGSKEPSRLYSKYKALYDHERCRAEGIISEFEDFSEEFSSEKFKSPTEL
jgi:hypothetical protein